MKEIVNDLIVEKAVLVGLELQRDQPGQLQYSMEELASLADTAGATVVRTLMQKRDRPDSATLIGAGKAAEVAEACREEDAGLVVVDREISPAQARNLEKICEVKVIDRTQLILDIFARRARTKEGKLQVELAQLEYLLPRLTGRGTELSRLGGGIGTRGPGETKLEVDRRRIRDRVADLRRELEEVRKHRGILRQGRKAVPFPLVALVGYTNAGKSSLLNKLTGAEVLVEDKLFATLDPTTRRVVLPNNETILLSDTVGFIQNLPHHLVAAFRATLEEVVEADLLLHVADGSHPNLDAQVEAVNKVLDSLGAGDKPAILVYNKMDLLQGAAGDDLSLKPPVPPSPGRDVRVVSISVRTGKGIDELLNAVAHLLAAGRARHYFFIPYASSNLLSLLHEKGRVLKEEHGPGGIALEVDIDTVWARRVEARLQPARAEDNQ